MSDSDLEQALQTGDVLIAKDLVKHRDELMRCYRDPWYFATRYCWTKKKEAEKPGEETEAGPDLVAIYPEWDYLKPVMEEIYHAQGSHLWEKSRQMLLTWTFCIVELHKLMFLEGYEALNGSRKEQLVDDGGDASTTYSTHGRIRFIWKRLPEWMRSPLHFAYLKIINQEPGMDGLIIGESANADIGRSGSFVDILLDEAAAIPNGEKAHTALSGCTFIARHYVSTHKVEENVFGRLAEDENSGFKVHGIHWSLRPDRDMRWYKEKSKGMLPHQVAAELDMVRRAGSEQSFIYGDCYDRESHIVGDDDLPAEDEILHIVGGQDWGFSIQGAFLKGLVDSSGNLWVVGETAAARMQVEQLDEGGNPTSDCWCGVAQSSGSELVVAGHENPEDIAKFQQHGVNTRSRKWSVEHGIREVTKLLRGAEGKRLYIHESCVTLSKDLPNYRWRTDARGEVIPGQPLKKHDHTPDALRHLVEAASMFEDAWVADLGEAPKANRRRQSRRPLGKRKRKRYSPHR